ncbi:hypothetical protein H2200_000199 [Cladophialophora chaetospira]|uniref:Enoyl-CoA hydratase/isomerase family protein n=1 Tax=Cladophialophora chaetospira TaxID=386627 RepID=A0AA39CQ39_9EURO|nr:hypothetical protein H2200_000199 [Cladophialophora chaetospira]
MPRKTAAVLNSRHFTRAIAQHRKINPRPLSTPDMNVVKVDFIGSEHRQGRIRREEVVLSKDDHKIVKVIIQNAQKGNALNPSLLKDLKTVCQELALREDIRCVILRGDRSEGDRAAGVKASFCTGMDVSHLASLDSPEQAKSLILAVHEAGQAIRDLPATTIAAIDGRCYGAGLELAASCDFRFATKDSLFAMPEVELGIPSVVQARLLANIIGWQKTRQLLLIGNTVDSNLAKIWGLIDYVFSTDGNLLAAVSRTAQRIAENAPFAMKAQKRLINYWEETDLRTGIDASVEAFAASFDNGAVEPKDYMNRFFEKRRAEKEKYKPAQLQTSDNLEATDEK